MPKLSRMLMVLAAAALSSLFFVPLWTIQLIAPQYPEGLGMVIRLDTVQGMTQTDLENINNLNHYIGMKPIDPGAMPELRFFPWIVAALVAGALIVALVGRRAAIVAWLATYSAAAVAGLADFWRWEYIYGHDIDRVSAIIKIPGMSYQPPLIGSKQLLNFTAISWPAAGGWLAGVAFALAALALYVALRRREPSGARAPEPCHDCPPAPETLAAAHG